MPYFFMSFGILLFLCSCKISGTKTQNQNFNMGTISYPEISPSSTQFKYPKIRFPEHAILDTLIEYETLSKSKYIVHYFQFKSRGYFLLNQAIKQYVKDQINREQSFLTPIEANEFQDIVHSFVLKPVRIYIDNQKISISNVIDTYTLGGNHHNYQRSSFNFALDDYKRIYFNDIFQLDNKKDSIALLQLAQTYTTNGCTDWGWPYEAMDFHLSDDGIYLYPNLSWACSSTHAFLPYELVKPFLRKGS